MSNKKWSKLKIDAKPHSGCDYHRIVMPFNNHNLQPKKDVVVFNRIHSKGAEYVLSLKRQGVKIVVDLDDFYQLNPEHYLASLYESNTHAIVAMVKLADVVIVTTEYLAYKIRHLNRNVVVIRNALPYDEGQFVLTRDRYSKTPLVWAGSETHKQDLAILPDFGKDLTICGFRRDSEVLSSREWSVIRENVAPTCVYEGVRPYANYMESYDGHQISLAPLLDNVFNNAKSNLKILEAGAKGLPLICSPRENYHTQEFKDLLFFAETPSEWKDITEYLLSAPDVCMEKGLALAKYVRTHYHIDVLNERRRLLFEEL